MWNAFKGSSRLRRTNKCKGWNNAWKMHIETPGNQTNIPKRKKSHTIRTASSSQKRTYKLHNERQLPLKNSLTLGSRSIKDI